MQALCGVLGDAAMEGEMVDSITNEELAPAVQWRSGSRARRAMSTDDTLVLAGPDTADVAFGYSCCQAGGHRRDSGETQ